MPPLPPYEYHHLNSQPQHGIIDSSGYLEDTSIIYTTSNNNPKVASAAVTGKTVKVPGRPYDEWLQPDNTTTKDSPINYENVILGAKEATHTTAKDSPINYENVILGANEATPPLEQLYVNIDVRSNMPPCKEKPSLEQKKLLAQSALFIFLFYRLFL